MDDETKRYALLAAAGTPVLIALWLTAASALFLMQHYYTVEGLRPWTIVVFAWKYQATPGVLSAVGQSLMISGMVVAMIPLAIAMKIQEGRRPVHGAARFANPREIKKAGLYADKGILVGKHRGQYLCLGGNTSVAVGAPTRSGKGVGVVVPNLLNWPDSVVALDMKKENYELTAGFRSASGQPVFMFDPGDSQGRTHRWNPLGYVASETGQRISDLQTIANLIWPDAPGADPIWPASARSLFLGLALYVLERPELPDTLGEIYRQATGGDDQRFLDEIASRQAEGNDFSPECVQSLSDYCNTNERTRQSIRKTFTASLELWANPIVDAATSANDFDLTALRRKRMTIYVGIAPGDVQRLRGLLNLFFQQVFDLNTRTLPEHDSSLQYQCLMLMDELPALGSMPTIAQNIAYVGGYGLRMLSVFQSDGQLRARDLYGPELTESFLENHAVRVYFPPKDQRVAQEISDTLGTETVTVRTTTRQLPTLTDHDRGKSISESQQSRELLKPQEVRQLPTTAAVLIVENCRPVRAEKIRYYEDKALSGRVRTAPEVQRLDIVAHQQWQATRLTETVSRPVTAEDLKAGKPEDLANLDVDFDDVEVPKGNLNDEQVDDLVGDIMAKVT